MIRISTIVTKKKKLWKIKNIKKVHAPRHQCEQIVSLADQGYPLYVIAQKTGCSENRIIAILQGRYDLKDQHISEWN